MGEYQHLIERSGRFELVALTAGPRYEADAVFGYALVTAGGARIWQDLSLSEGRSRLQALSEAEQYDELPTHLQHRDRASRRLPRGR